ncbi:hypothetical protein C1Y40_03383 [Mycobacterium talmoniae]|uniref:Uncharacterized protein n=1 Tax=Mycobacterium talmoniae TaxID=1858794 RepID=A0A2S8BIE3_9MYCO|nr:hypothetical protein C1Y40_03383 [Mycobacterium talmoniae]
MADGTGGPSNAAQISTAVAAVLRVHVVRINSVTFIATTKGSPSRPALIVGPDALQKPERAGCRTHAIMLCYLA